MIKVVVFFGTEEIQGINYDLLSKVAAFDLILIRWVEKCKRTQ